MEQRDRLRQTMEEVKQRCLDEQEKRLEKQKKQEMEALGECHEWEMNEAVSDALEQLKNLRGDHQSRENAANATAEKLQGELEAAKKRVTELEGNVEAADNKANTLEGEVKAAKTRAEELERKVEAANKRANELDGNFGDANARLEELGAEVEAANKRANDASARVKELEKKVKTADNKVNVLEDDVKTAKAKANDLEGKVKSVNKRLEETKLSKDKWRNNSQTFQGYVQSQLSLFGISDTTIQNETVFNWRKVNAANPTIRADIDDAVNHYRLIFMVPLMELVTVQAGDLAVAQI